MINVAAVQNLCNTLGYPYHIKGTAPEVLLVGEYHHVTALPGQERLIKLIKPRVVLHEAADEAMLEREATSRILAVWPQKFGVEVLLGDMLPQHRRWAELVLIKTLELAGVSLTIKSQYAIETALDLIREAVVGRQIAALVSARKTPAMVVMGERHVMPGSALYPYLNKTPGYFTLLQRPNAVEVLRADAAFFSRPTKKA